MDTTASAEAGLFQEAFMYSEPLADGRISIHDCLAHRVTVENGMLTFYFPEGIWVIPGHPSNPTEDMVCTGPAKMTLEPFCGDVWDWNVQSLYTLRYPWQLARWWKPEKFVEALNRGSFRVEFINWYIAPVTALFQCALRSDRRPRYRDCNIQMDVKNIVCHWETMNFDRVW